MTAFRPRIPVMISGAACSRATAASTSTGCPSSTARRTSNPSRAWLVGAAEDASGRIQLARQFGVDADLLVAAASGVHKHEVAPHSCGHAGGVSRRSFAVR